MNYRLLNHTADTAIEFYGSTLNQLFENSAVSLSEIIFDISSDSIDHINNNNLLRLSFLFEDIATAFVDFLREILYQINQNAFFFLNCKIEKLNRKRIIINCYYQSYKEEDIKNEFKAVTYHDIEIKKKKINDEEKYSIIVVFDI